MPSRADLDTDGDRLAEDVTLLADENERLRKINADMLAALKYALPILRDALPTTIMPIG